MKWDIEARAYRARAGVVGVGKKLTRFLDDIEKLIVDLQIRNKLLQKKLDSAELELTTLRADLEASRRMG